MSYCSTRHSLGAPQATRIERGDIPMNNGNCTGCGCFGSGSGRLRAGTAGALNAF